MAEPGMAFTTFDDCVQWYTCSLLAGRDPYVVHGLADAAWGSPYARAVAAEARRKAESASACSSGPGAAAGLTPIAGATDASGASGYGAATTASQPALHGGQVMQRSAESSAGAAQSGAASGADPNDTQGASMRPTAALAAMTAGVAAGPRPATATTTDELAANRAAADAEAVSWSAAGSVSRPRCVDATSSTPVMATPTPTAGEAAVSRSTTSTATDGIAASRPTADEGAPPLSASGSASGATPPPPHDIVLLQAGGRYVFVSTVADLFRDGSIMAADSIVVLADGRLLRSRTLVQSLGEASAQEYHAPTDLQRPATEWWMSVFEGRGELTLGQALTYDDEDCMPQDTYAREVLAAEAARLPRLSHPSMVNEAAGDVLARVANELNASEDVPPWEDTAEWPRLQDTEAAFKLAGRFADGVKVHHDGIFTLAEAVTSGSVSPTALARRSGAAAKDLVAVGAMLRTAAATATGTLVCLDATIAGPRRLSWWLDGLLDGNDRMGGQGLRAWASLRMVITGVAGDRDVRTLAAVLCAAGTTARALMPLTPQPEPAPVVQQARLHLFGAVEIGQYALLVAAGGDREWHMARRLGMADATYDGSLVGKTIDKKCDAVRGDMLGRQTFPALRALTDDPMLRALHGAIACKRFSPILHNMFEGAPPPTRLLSGNRDGSGEADELANRMVVNMLELVELCLTRPTRGLQQVCTIWEGSPPRSANSTHGPRVIPEREEHCALDDWPKFEAQAERAREQGLYTYVDSDGCAMGLVNRDGLPVKKTRRWHLWGPREEMLAVVGVDGGIASRQCACTGTHGSLKARSMPAAGQQFETVFTEVYVPVEGCLVGEALIRLAGYSPTTLVAAAQAFQEGRGVAAPSAPAGVTNDLSGGGVAFFYSTGTALSALSPLDDKSPFTAAKAGILARKELEWLAGHVNGLYFRSREHFFAVGKLVFAATGVNRDANLGLINTVLGMRPGQLKGQNGPTGKAKLKGLDSKLWDDISELVMEAGAQQQLDANEHLRNVLMSTGDAYLAEASPWDSVWGIGLSAERARGVPRSAWGQNKHGKLLMRRRAALLDDADRLARASTRQAAAAGAAPVGGVT